MALVTLEAIGSNGEQLALTAGKKLGVAVGWDEEFQCATFDSDEHAGEDELEAALYEELEALDPDWRTHLRLAE